MAIDPKSLTIDYKTLMNNTSISERVGLTKSSAGQQLLSSLSPTDLASAFPDYYKKNNPDANYVEFTSLPEARALYVKYGAEAKTKIIPRYSQT